MTKQKNASQEKKKAKRVSYHRQPEEMSLREWQIALRRQYGKGQHFTLANLGDHPGGSLFQR